MKSHLDERGRIVLPKRLRERLGLEPGRRLDIEETKEGIMVRPQRDIEEVLGRLRGAIHRGNRDPKAQRLDPLEVKKIWEPKK